MRSLDDLLKEIKNEKLRCPFQEEYKIEIKFLEREKNRGRGEIWVDLDDFNFVGKISYKNKKRIIEGNFSFKKPFLEMLFQVIDQRKEPIEYYQFVNLRADNSGLGGKYYGIQSFYPLGRGRGIKDIHFLKSKKLIVVEVENIEEYNTASLCLIRKY